MNWSMIMMLSIFLTLALSINAQTSSSDLISQVCEHAPRKGFCQSALRSDPRSEKADTAGLAAVALRLAASNATDNAAFIGRMLGGGAGGDGGSLDPAVEQCLSDCADQYADAVEQMEASIAAASTGDYDGLRPWVKAAIADAESCEEGFRMEAGADQMVMSHRNKVFKLLCDTALRIVELLVLA
ncbi:putative invertase inhibitor [Rhodamnia argentea]|uniref:Invertase inhibitor n=1 Tax=Rhodamnia argentea TaxID=178133 RepID=A0A8B8PE40_9MYRT|nr:putative invertase inhibitor [Rhodamnia argentea]